MQANKTTKLRDLIESSNLEFLMEAHNGISARIVEEAGFKGIWASGLALSAQFGVRDNNEASWTQVVDMLEFMTDTTAVPILLDGDTGYGNFNNMRRLVKKLEQRGIAGVCIEDKLFPKSNSFLNGEQQPLADIEEFCGKIKAGKDSQRDPDFCVIARIEAFIAGWGIEEALCRADAYQEAGADAILIHSKLTRADEILAFAEQWKERLPIIIVPSKYYSTPVRHFRNAGIRVVIWANHMIRAAATNMKSIAREIKETETLINIEDRIEPIKEIFRLQGADELACAERRYFVSKQTSTGAIILGASRGDNMDSVTKHRPKVMVPIAGRPLLRRLVDGLKRQQVNHITVVTGYKPEAISEGIPSGIELVHNRNYMISGELASLACAKDSLIEDTIVTYGDLLIRSYILRELLDTKAEIAIVVDSFVPNRNTNEFRDLVACSHADDHSLFLQQVTLQKITKDSWIHPEEPNGRWIGMLRAQGKGVQWILESLNHLKSRNDFSKLGMTDLLNFLVESGKAIKVLYIHGHWLDVNNLEDLARASEFAHGKHTTQYSPSPKQSQ